MLVRSDYGGCIDKNFKFGGNSRGGPPMSSLAPNPYDNYRGPPSFGGGPGYGGRQSSNMGPVPLSSHGGSYMPESVSTTQVYLFNILV